MKPSDLTRPLDTRADEADVVRQVQTAGEQYRRVLRERLPELARRRNLER